VPPSRGQDALPELRLVPGPLAAEAELLRDLERELEGHPEGDLEGELEGELDGDLKGGLEGDPEGRLGGELSAARGAAVRPWAAPLLIVVPSRSLREHLQARIVAARGRALLGVRCVTLFGLALETVEDAVGRQLAGGDLFPFFARRLARDDRPLRQALDHLADGYSPLLGTVRDLLDAGFDPAHAEALLEALASDGGAVASRREIARAQALVRVAAGALEALREIGAGRRSTLLQAAAERLRHGEPGWAARAVWIYGFADATGVATDFIEALLARRRGRVYLDQPPDPAQLDQPDAGVRFTRRFRDRLAASARLTTAAATAERPRIELFRALGSDGEIREVARRVRELLDAGARPESIAVVARQLAPYARAVRIHFPSLGVPFSALGGEGTKDRRGRRGEALADLLARRAALSVERWLELVDRRFGDRAHFDLRTAFATLGTGRVREVGALAGDGYRLAHDLALPVRHGFAATGDESAGARGLVLRRRKVPAAALREAVAAARALDDHFTAWERAATLEAHLGAFSTLLEDHLGWRPDGPGRALAQAAAGAWRALPPTHGLTLDEFAEGVAASLRDQGTMPLGGRGGGVQILDAVEARGRTCRHLFLVGLNRGVFPRVVREDPLLPDALRNVISRQGFGVLPDLPDKRAGLDEERFLFAQLLSSSPRVTLSWQDTDDDQRPLAPSPLLERLRWAAGGEERRHPVLARPVVAQRAAVPRTPFENGIAIALAGSRSRLGRVLPLLLPAGGGEAAAASRARLAVLAELDPAPGSAARRELGPYHGFVGPAGAGDPRTEQRLYVTALERLGGCPWQVFLQRVLRLEPVPDPLATLPGLTPLLLGALGHDVLEEIVRRGLIDDPADLDEARRRIPQAIPWPADDELAAIVRRAAEALCRKEGIAVQGFGRVLGGAVRPYLDVARRLDWEGRDGLHVLGVELEGRIEIEDLAGRGRAIHFRADRLDLGERGLVLTDYKTGRRTVSTAKQARSRRRHLLASVARGERLQAVAYVLAAGEPGDTGRYLFVHPELPDDRELRDVRVAGDDEELATAFARAAGAALAAWDAGTFFPRLVEPERDEEPARCERCDVRDACLRGDTGARSRLRGWMDRGHARFRSAAPLAPWELVLLTLWRLPTLEET